MSKDYKTCHECEGIDISGIPTVRFIEKGNGKCKHCKGSGHDHAAEALVGLSTLGIEKGKIDCKYCYGTGQCQTCGGTGYYFFNSNSTNPTNDDSDQTTTNNYGEAVKALFYLFIFFVIFSSVKGCWDRLVAKGPADIGDFIYEFQDKINANDINAIKKLTELPVISLTGGTYSIPDFMEKTELSKFNLSKRKIKQLPSPNNHQIGDFRVFKSDEKVYEMVVYRRTNSFKVWDGNTVHSGNEIFLYILVSKKKHRLIAFAGPISVQE